MTKLICFKKKISHEKKSQEVYKLQRPSVLVSMSTKEYVSGLLKSAEHQKNITTTFANKYWEYQKHYYYKGSENLHTIECFFCSHIITSELVWSRHLSHP